MSVLQYLPHSVRYQTVFRPHVAIKADGPRLDTDDTIEIGGFSIVETSNYSPNWRVIAKIGLKGADMVTDARLIKKQAK